MTEVGDGSSVVAMAPGLRVAEVRIQDFRAIRELCVPLSDLTVLVGENNVGKSTFLRALEVAIGGSRPVDDDLHVPETGQRGAEFVVDIKLVPADGSEFDDALTVRLGDAIQLPGGEPQFVALRTRGRVSADGTGPTIEQRFLNGWSCNRDEALALADLDPPNRDQLRLLSFFLLDARRDIVDELRQRRSYWGRLLSDVGVSDADRVALEATLATVGAEVVAKSSVLTTLRGELEHVRDALGSVVSSVTIEAIPARIDELIRAVDVLLKAPGSAALPLRLQGMGSRSLAVVMVFQAFARLRLGVDQDIRPLPVSAFEEPEAHLHPHPQRAMFHLVSELPGQKLVSTHSPYVTQVADLFDVRVFTRAGGTIQCRYVARERPDGTPTFDAEGLAKARRFVQRNNGEVLFARCVVLYEGDTEDGALPVIARARWGVDPTAHGVSLVDAQGAGNFKHFVRVLDAFSIPWVVLADGDSAGQDAVRAIGSGLERATSGDEIFMVPGGTSLEKNLVDEGFHSELKAAIESIHGATALEDYRTTLHGKERAQQRLGTTSPRDGEIVFWSTSAGIECGMHSAVPTSPRRSCARFQRVSIRAFPPFLRSCLGVLTRSSECNYERDARSYSRAGGGCLTTGGLLPRARTTRCRKDGSCGTASRPAAPRLQG